MSADLSRQVWTSTLLSQRAGRQRRSSQVGHRSSLPMSGGLSPNYDSINLPVAVKTTFCYRHMCSLSLSNELSSAVKWTILPASQTNFLLAYCQVNYFLLPSDEPLPSTVKSTFMLPNDHSCCSSSLLLLPEKLFPLVNETLLLQKLDQNKICFVAWQRGFPRKFAYSVSVSK